MLEEVVVQLTGAVNAVSCKAIQDDLLQKIEAGAHHLTVDLQDVTAIDSAGLGMFVTVFKQIQKNGGRLDLANASEGVIGIFEQTHLDKLFIINGLTAAERQQVEEHAARSSAPIPSQGPARVRAETAAAIRRSARPVYLYSSLLLSLALLAATQYLFYQRFTDNDLLPYLRSNAAIVRSVLLDQRKVTRKLPASGEEVQQLLLQKGINFHNVYTREPQRIVTGQRGEPGDILYEPTDGGFRLRVVTRDGSPLREGTTEFVLTESRRK